MAFRASASSPRARPPAVCAVGPLPPPSVAHALFGTFGLVGIWVFEALNFLVHKAWRPEPWNWYSQGIAYALWAMQLWSFARCQFCDPGALHPAWTEDEGAAGKWCPRTHRVLPPRSRYVRRAGGVVLGLDHYCAWLGTPVGLRNRKSFVLYVAYSAVFAAMGAAHSAAELAVYCPRRLGQPAFGLPSRLLGELAALRPAWAAWELGAAVHSGLGQYMFLCASARRAGQLRYVLALSLSAALNPIVAALLGGVAAHQLLMVARNRTTLAPRDARYDLGLRANMRQCFGERAAFWLLPVGCCSAGDGLRWPLNPEFKVQSRRREH